MVVTICVAGWLGYAWWNKGEPTDKTEVKQDSTIQIKGQIAKLKYNIKSMERRRTELDEQLKNLPDIEALKSQSEKVRAQTEALPTSAKLRRESVGIKADGSHVQIGEIPPVVQTRMREELGLSERELRRLNGQ